MLTKQQQLTYFLFGVGCNLDFGSLRGNFVENCSDFIGLEWNGLAVKLDLLTFGRNISVLQTLYIAFDCCDIAAVVSWYVSLDLAKSARTLSDEGVELAALFAIYCLLNLVFYFQDNFVDKLSFQK